MTAKKAVKVNETHKHLMTWLKMGAETITQTYVHTKYTLLMVLQKQLRRLL